MHSIMEGEDGVEPHDVFVDLGILIVEGRVPGGAWATGRGYGEGPHCAGIGISAPALAVNRHECDPNNSFLCKRAENLTKHMQLLWQNAIPVCIEVLLCADCQCGQQKAKSPDIANVPSSTDLLLEQWMVTVVSKRCQESSQITVRGLFQAVRSQLHFSQLAAWWSSSKGSKPAHVNYRVTVPGEAFASQFQRRPLEHSFPVASLTRSSAIKVTVRSLPRMEMVPHILCPMHDDHKVEKKVEQDGDHLGAVGGVKSGAAVADEQTIWGHGKDGVRKKCAVEAGTGPMLGDSLLDPPPSLDLFARRIQSPSRCGSPSLEAPEHLLFGRAPVPAVRSQGVGGRALVGRWRENSPPSPPMSSQSQRRLGRQGLARRRDANNATTNASVDVGTPWQKPCGDPPGTHILPRLVDDRMQNPCTRPGKHHCRCAYDEDLEPLTSPPESTLKASSVSFGKSTPVAAAAAAAAASCCKNITPSSSDTSTNAFRCQQGSSDKHFKSTTVQKGSLSKKLESAGKAKLNLELSQREVEEVLAVLRDRNLPPNAGVGKTLSESASHISKSTTIVPSTAKPMQVFNMSSLPSTSPTMDKADLLMGAILRSSEKERVTKCGKHKCDIKGARTCKSKTCDKCRLGKSAKSVVADQDVDDDLIDERVIQTEPMGRKSKSRTLQLTPASSSSNSSQAQKQPQPMSPIKKHKLGPLGGKINNVNHSPKCLSASMNNSKDHQHNISDTVPLKQLNKDSAVIRTESSAVGIKNEKVQCYRRSEKETELSTKNVEERASPFLNKSLNQLKNLFKGETIKTQAQENGWEGVPDRPVPSALDKAKFRRSLDSAASMVFHSRTGLPLTSSPAPVRKGTCFDFDSSLNSVSAIRSALFESVPATPPDDTLSLSSDDAESESGARSPSSPGIGGPVLSPLGPSSWSHYTLAPCASLLGSFEESVLNGRLEPVSTVQGFTADLGASGSFCPRHLVLPVTVFFYTLGDNDKVSTPYLGHINLGKKGYNVPRSGTIQVTLFNPLGTVVKMFVVMYDLADMPPNSQTFLRQRTLYMPANPPQEMQSDNMQKWLRYLIHLRFSSSKSGRIYLHTDIRMIIFRKSDVDTATAHGMEMAYELRSFTHGPTNPKFSPYK